MSKTVIIIPSRMSAKRLPNKPLLKINGKSIISLVYLKAVACKIGKVIVATEDKKISDEIKKYKGNVILTSKKHQSGTDRIWEAFKKLKDKNLKYIINLQGDEPTICPNDIMRLNKTVIKNKFDILLAGGQDHLKGKIFRVGHLGYVNDRDIITVVSAMSNTLLKLGKISAQQAGEALVMASKYLKGN